MRKGFTLLELLGSIAIIAILMGLMGSAAYAARQRAFKATAYSEAQQLTAALKSYWVSKRSWPKSIAAAPKENGYSLLTEDSLKDLIGGGDDGFVYIDIPPSRFDDDGGQKYFCDPWGHPYRVKFDEISDISTAVDGIKEMYDITVNFPNSYRDYYTDGIYDTADDGN